MRLLRREHVYTELGGRPISPNMIGTAYPHPVYRAGLDFFKIVCEEVGTDKILWGSDYPTILRDYTYRQVIDSVRRDSSFLSERERTDILGDNAEALLKQWGYV